MIVMTTMITDYSYDGDDDGYGGHVLDVVDDDERYVDGHSDVC